MFKPIVHECVVEDGGETYTFYVREASGREILVAAKDVKKKQDRPPIEGTTELLADFVVNKDGTAIALDGVAAILDMRLSAMKKVTDMVQEKAGFTQGDAEKKA